MEPCLTLIVSGFVRNPRYAGWCRLTFWGVCTQTKKWDLTWRSNMTYPADFGLWQKRNWWTQKLNYIFYLLSKVTISFDFTVKIVYFRFYKPLVWFFISLLPHEHLSWGQHPAHSHSHLTHLLLERCIDFVEAFLPQRISSCLTWKYDGIVCCK